MFDIYNAALTLAQCPGFSVYRQALELRDTLQPYLKLLPELQRLKPQRPQLKLIQGSKP